MNQDKIFVGYVKTEEKQGQHGPWTSTRLSFTRDHLKLLESHLNENGYVNLKFNRSQKGNEYMEIDTWKPSNPYNMNEQPQSNYGGDDQPPAQEPTHGYQAPKQDYQALGSANPKMKQPEPKKDEFGYDITDNIPF